MRSTASAFCWPHAGAASRSIATARPGRSRIPGILRAVDIFILLGEYMRMDLDDTLIALADDTRRGILKRLASGDARVTEVAAPFEISLNSVSKHIRILERAGLVSRRVAGRDHFLSLERKPFDELTEWMLKTRDFWSARLDELEAALRAEDAIKKASKSSLKRKGK